MKTLQKGFTLIELMIVVAIVGILAAIALPAYQEYIARAKVTEGLAALDAMKLSAAEYIASNNSMPPDANSAGIAITGGATYVSTVGYASDGTSNMLISVQLTSINTTLNGTKIGMQGFVESDSSVKWLCVTDATAASGKYRFLPSNCRFAKAATLTWP